MVFQAKLIVPAAIELGVPTAIAEIVIRGRSAHHDPLLEIGSINHGAAAADNALVQDDQVGSWGRWHRCTRHWREADATCHGPTGP